LYEAYDTKLTELIKPITIEISNTKDGHIDTFSEPKSEDVVKKLFSLYMELKSFSDKGLDFGTTDCDFGTKNYFDWFSGGIDRFHQFSVFSALSR
jgi:hypothetical protein